MSVLLPKRIFDEITAHAVETFPQECCGLIIRRTGRCEVVRVTNIQNEKHAHDPERFPRSAETAYTMGPEAHPVLIDHDRKRLDIDAIYHSHPQHDAYFSAEDRKQATVWGEPSYPNAAQIVISIFDRVVRATKAFRWSEQEHEFVEVELRIAGERTHE